MLLTEEKARTKWCPHARVIRVGDHPYQAPYNRVVVTKNEAVNLVDNDGNEQTGLMQKSGVDYTPKSSTCIASGCMAWRQAAQLNDKNPKGYCGLAETIKGPYD